MFTDIAGYSRLMEEDEQRTIEVLKQHNEIVLPLIDATNGDVIDAIGDGLLILFPTVRDAVTCAGSIHDAVEAHNRSCEPGFRFKLRIGVHLGEIWRDDGRVFGNGVNVAARVQPFAAPGGICITEDVYRIVVNKLTLAVVSMGRQELKNISRKIELYSVTTGYEEPEEPPQTAAAERSARQAPRDEVGELYETMKERLISERESAAKRGDPSQRTAAGGSSLETRIESKVFGLVEHVMDKALDTWESMPEEKRARTIQAIRTEIAKESDSVDVKMGGHHRHHEDKDKSASGDIGSSLATGAVFGIGFGIGAFGFGISWMVWPFGLIGVLPFAVGLVKSIKQIIKRRRAAQSRPQEVERAVITAAKRLGGTVTVVQISSHTDLSLDDVQAALDRMAAKGYVSQQIDPEGIITYEFPMLVSRTAGEPGSAGA
jgi:class 3 adenylate cyclase